MGTKRPSDWHPLRLEEVSAPVLFCDHDGEIVQRTGVAEVLLRRFGRADATRLPATLWATLEAVELGTAVEWRPPSSGDFLIGCTRYVAGPGFLVLMKEVSGSNAAASVRLQRQQLEAVGRLVGSIAHELRNSVASILYSVDLLQLPDAPEATRIDSREKLVVASQRVRAIVDGLMDYAELGPRVSVSVSLKEVLTRSQGFLRRLYHKGGHELRVEFGPDASMVEGNSLAIEHVFVSLLLNAAEAAGDDRARVTVRTDLAPLPDAEGEELFVRARVSDDGPGVPAPLRASIFRPSVSTRAGRPGLGLSHARQAVERAGGRLLLEDSEEGATFAVYLRRDSAPNGGS